MSKWTEVRDGFVSALDVNDVVDAAKNQILDSLAGEGMEAIEAVADKFVQQVQAQAASETGWNAIRDKFVLPLLINGTIWGIKFVLSKSTSNEQKTAQSLNEKASNTRKILELLAYFFITINRKRLTKQRKRGDMMSTLDDIMTAKEAAERWGLDPITVR